MRRLAVAVVVGLSVGAAAFASASTVTVNSGGGLGAGNTLVASCDTAVATSFTLGTFDTTSGYTVTAVQVSSIASPSCDGKSVSVTLADGSGTNVAEGGPVLVPAGATSVTVNMIAPVGASKVASVYVVIS